MEIISRTNEIIYILSKKLPIEIVNNILNKEKEILNEEAIQHHLINSPIYCGPGWDGYFFSLKKYRHVLYDTDFELMNHIRIIGGSTELARKQRAERIWGSYLPSLRF